MRRLDPFDRRGALSTSGSEWAIYRERARRLGLPFASQVRLAPGTAVNVAAIRRGTFAVSAGDGAAYVAPDEATLAKIAAWLAAYPAAARRLSVATPSAIRAALTEAGAPGLLVSAVRRLVRRHPDMSAQRVITAGQVAAGLAIAAALALSFFAAPTATLVAVNLIGAMFFFGVTVLRFLAARLAADRRLIAQVFAPEDDDELPVYTILVPLFREAAMVRDLVAALDRLDWPGIR